MTNEVTDQVRRYLDYAAEGVTMAAPNVISRQRRGPLVAVAVAACIVAVAVPSLLLLGNTESSPLAVSGVTRPLQLGDEYVWPDSGFVGSADEIAAEFARVALGWEEVVTTTDPEASPDGPTWTTIQHAGTDALQVLSIPIGEAQRAMIQIGTNTITTGISSGAEEQLIGIPGVDGAHTADLHIRFEDSDEVIVVIASARDVEQGRIIVPGESPIASLVIIYRNAAGEALAADGGRLGT